MAYRVTVSDDDGDTYWLDLSNDLRDKAVNVAMSEGLDMKEALSTVLAFDVENVEEK